MKKKILIIEDDANLLFGMQAKFSVQGFDVEVDAGETSVERVIVNLSRCKPDFIISDVIMPYINGFTLLKAIKADENLRHIPIFIFSDVSDEDAKIRGMNLGADYFFVKNELLLDEFVTKIKTIITKHYNF